MVKELSLREKAAFSKFVLCQVAVEGKVSLPGVKDCKQEEGLCGMEQEKEGI